MSLFVGLWVAILAGCGQTSQSATPPMPVICDGTPPPEAESLCAVQRAATLTRANKLDDAQATCDALPSATWRGECHFQISEALADLGQLDPALASCADTGQYARMCVGHALWMMSETLIDATPSSANADALVDALIAKLPPPPETASGSAWDVSDIARSAAWHGIYAGAGSADPTAARGASPKSRKYAISAFAWEATRLLGTGPEHASSEQASPEQAGALLAPQVIAIWEGTTPPAHGSIQAQPCWDAQMMPRPEMDAEIWLPSIRTYPGNARFYDDDLHTDLTIATIEGAWAHGKPTDAKALLELRDSPSVALQKTLARQLALMPDQVAAVEDVYPKTGSDDAVLRKVFKKTRKAVEKNRAGRSVVSNAKGECK